jgi:hypothetical protein
MSGAVRGKRWPNADTIRAAQEAVERGDSLALQSRRLRYVTEFFGLTVAMRPADVTPRQWAARWNWAQRRERLGPSGFSPQGQHALRLNLVSAAIAKRRIPLSKTCRRGHKWTAQTTRMTRKGRSCLLCETLVRAERARSRREWIGRKEQIAAARAYMLDVGRRSNMDPSSTYWRDRYVAARDRWQKLKRAA